MPTGAALQESKCRNDTDEMGFCTENARLRRLILTNFYAADALLNLITELSYTDRLEESIAVFNEIIAHFNVGLSA
jgi:hypothetical protein